MLRLPSSGLSIWVAFNPNHVTNQFDQNCTACHSNTAWTPSTFDHTATTFPLTGGHQNRACIDCHAAGYVNTPTTCYACHQTDYNATVDPDHKIGQFDQNCLTCHNNTAWTPSGFDHNSKTTYALTGAHQAINCATCHSTQFKGTTTQCYGCHQADFLGAFNPNHVTNQFDQNCIACHTNTAWTPATFDHTVTTFPLTGGHQNRACIDCHAAGYVNTPTTCYACHQADYNATVNPDHKIGQFDQNCLTCHNNTAWTPSSFNHSTRTAYPLSGSHMIVPCAGCHRTQFKGTPSYCDACHHVDYQGAQNPNHATAGFPLNCTSCHRTTNWNDVTWNHDGPYFPIYTGKHRGEWNTCRDCHTNQNNFKIFTCLSCHEHNMTSMNNQHKNQRGYSYDSNACYSCHPRGSD